jgi:hypothetical protein
VDPTSRQDVQLLSKFINSEQARPQTPPPPSPKSDDEEHVVANVSYQVFVLKRHAQTSSHEYRHTHTHTHTHTYTYTHTHTQNT